MFFKTTLFVFFYYLILISTLGYGLLFSNFLKIRNQVFSFSVSGILGVIFLTFLSYITNFFFIFFTARIAETVFAIFLWDYI